MILGLKGESPTVVHWADVAQVGSCISVCELCYPNCTYALGCGGALRLLTSADLSQAWPLRTTSDHRVRNATLRTAECTYTIIPCELNSQRLSYLVKRSRENYLLSWYILSEKKTLTLLTKLTSCEIRLHFFYNLSPSYYSFPASGLHN